MIGDLLQIIATWAVAIIGTCGLVWIAIWCSGQIFRRVISHFGGWKALVRFIKATKATEKRTLPMPAEGPDPRRPIS